MTEKPLTFQRKDDGPQRVVGTYEVTEDNETVKKRIRVFTGPRKALRASRLGRHEQRS